MTRFVRAESGRLEFDEAKNQLVLTLEHARAEPRDRKDPENFSAAFSSASIRLLSSSARPLSACVRTSSVPNMDAADDAVARTVTVCDAPRLSLTAPSWIRPGDNSVGSA